MKTCMDNSTTTEGSIQKINKKLQREEELQKYIDFTVKTLQEYDNVEPQGLDIIFEYKVGDQITQEEEAK